MRKADLRKNHQSLDDAIARYRAFMRKILGAERVIKAQTEKRDLAESVLLRLCANWESFVDEHLADCVNVDHSKLGEFFAVKIPANPSKGLCQALIFGSGYKDFKSIGDLKGFSKKILPDSSNPFLKIGKAHSDRIDEVYTIRNYLAHYSAPGTRSLKALYKAKYGMNNFLEPGQFLLGYKGKRLWAYFDAFEGASQDIASSY